MGPRSIVSARALRRLLLVAGAGFALVPIVMAGRPAAARGPLGCPASWISPPSIPAIALDVDSLGPEARLVGFVSERRPRPIVARLDNGIWKSMPEPFKDSGYISSLDQTPSGETWIVGTRLVSRAIPVARRRDETSPWQKLDYPPLGAGGVFTDVVALHDGRAVAVGYTQSRERQTALIVRWDGARATRELIGSEPMADGSPVPGASPSSDPAGSPPASSPAGSAAPSVAPASPIGSPAASPATSDPDPGASSSPSPAQLVAAADSALLSVAETDMGGLWAAGWMRSAEGVRPLLVRRTTKGWIPAKIDAAVGGEAVLSVVQIDEDGLVVAGGTRHDGRAWAPFIVQQQPDGSWVAHAIGDPGVDGSVGLVRTLLAGRDGTIVGGVRWAPGGATRPLYGIWSGDRWTYRTFPGDADNVEVMGADRAFGATWLVGRRGDHLLAIRSCDPAVPGIDPTPQPTPIATPEPKPTPRPTPRPKAGAAPTPVPAMVAVDIAGPAGIARMETTYGSVIDDLDGDGDEDIVLGRHGRPLELLINDGGRFSTARGAPFPGGDRHGCSTGDVDGDGSVDLMCTLGAHHGTGFKVNELWLAPLTATEQVNESLARGLDDPLGRGRNAVLFDADRDGDPDLLVANEPGRFDALPSIDRFYRNEGGTFVAAPEAGLDEPIGGACLIPADMDDDGWTDLVACGFILVDADAFLRYFHNDHGRFTDRTDLVRGDDLQVQDAGVADFDGDGRLDIAAMGTFATRVVLQRPDGTFTEGWTERVPGGRDLAVGDADGDGDPDLYVARAVGTLDQPDAVLLNDGTGTRFTWIDTPPTLRGGVAESVAAIDADGDGADEFLVLNGRKGAGRIQLISVRPRG